MLRTALVWLLAAAAAACSQETIEVRPTDHANPQDYGRSAMLAAKLEAERTPASPASFAKFAAAVDALRPGMTEGVREQAELHLVFLALGPMEALREASPAAQLAELGVTVWPTAFEVPAEPGETPMAYVERICNAELASECRYVVPEARPVVLARYAWNHLLVRSRGAMAMCVTCASKPRYAEAIKAFEAGYERAWEKAREARASTEISDWPLAGEHAQPWSDPVVFSKVGGVHLAGAPVEGGGWQRAMAAKRGERTVLGVYLGPGDKVRSLLAVAEDAAAAGYRELALVARAPDYPYTKLEYRLQIGRRARGTQVRVRDVETVQVFIQAVDATIAKHGPKVRL